ncbi:MAG: hypothetical protein ACRCZF_17690, partial [Gemmataceae bacterium]
MIATFFHIAMVAPGRQIAFRRLVVGHTLLVALLAAVVAEAHTLSSMATAAQLLLILAMVEGAAIIGWRLTQLPKSQALEFMLVSPLQPRRFFLGELLVGVARFALIQLSGLPLYGLMIFAGLADWPDLWVLFATPLLWGTLTGVALTAWVYEPPAIRKIGELLGLACVMLYLVVGVLAAENLGVWLQKLPDSVGQYLYFGLLELHHANPFGVLRYWFDPWRSDPLAWNRLIQLNAVGLGLLLLFTLRATTRLLGHFHDRHYRPIDSSRASQQALIGDRPLSWWAVKRVMEYSGRVNLWLANGFALLFAANILAGDAWPSWMGKLIFQMFESWGGAPMLATALAMLAAVPAVYQFGLWDATVQDRCARLELLLLTQISDRDYAHASFAAAWRRGRGYFIGVIALLLAMAISGRVFWWDALGAFAGAIALWSLGFALGFRGFATGTQT